MPLSAFIGKNKHFSSKIMIFQSKFLTYLEITFDLRDINQSGQNYDVGQILVHCFRQR
jgi:hypothetical protein